MARKRAVQVTPVAADPEVTASALAKAIVDGDIVNFRLIFAPFSPGRDDTPEDYASDKYRYLHPDAEMAASPEFKAALGIIKDQAVWDHILGELSASGPPCLPSGPLIALADNAVKLGKYSAAAQAYELLRIREDMQAAFADEADKALESGDLDRAVRGFDIAAGLNYDYAGFPDPLPLVNDYQTRALVLHGEYPRNPQDCVAALPAERFVESALKYLLFDHHLVARVLKHPLETQLSFLYALIHRKDPDWAAFAERFRDACGILERFREAITEAAEAGNGRLSLQDEFDIERAGDPWVLPATLLGRELEDAQWWQYMKDLAIQHPAAPLFVARQLMGDEEVLVPRLPGDSPVPKALGLPSDNPVVAIPTT